MIGLVTVLITAISLANMHSLMMLAANIAYTSYWKSLRDDLHINHRENFRWFSFTLSCILMNLLLWWRSPKLHFNDGELHPAAKDLWSWKYQKKGCQGKLAFGKWCQPLSILQGIWSEFPDYVPTTPEKDQLLAMKRRVAPGMVTES